MKRDRGLQKAACTPNCWRKWFSCLCACLVATVLSPRAAKAQPTLAEALDAAGFSWSTNGNAGWFAVTDPTHDGVDAARSGNIGPNQQSSLQTTAEWPGVVTFWWKVSSEPFDVLSFSVDGVTWANISGEVNWRLESFALPAGTHVLTWTYSKDESDSAGLDAGWLDQIAFTLPVLPSILSQPTDQTVPPDDTASFTVEASGSPPPTYRWRFYGTDLNDAVGKVVGAQSNRLAILNAQSTDSGVYSVAVSNASGWVLSSNAVLTVLPGTSLSHALNATNLTWQTSGDSLWLPQTDVTHDGVKAVRSGAITNSQQSWLETTVTGPGTLTYWWKVSSESGYDFLEFYLDGVLQSGRISGTVDWQKKTNTIVAGAHTVRWRYAKDLSQSSGQDAAWLDEVYYVTASQAPQIVTQPVSRTNVVGSTATFTVTAAGTAPLAYQWRHNGTALANGGAVSGVTTTNLTITNVQTNHAGDYSVVITNAAGSVTSIAAVLTVVPPPYAYTTNNGAITITGYTGPGGAATIPNTINGLPVTSLGDHAFYFNSSLTNITIPESVTNIGSSVFYACSILTAITVDANNPAYNSAAGVLFNKSQTVIIAYPGGKAGSYTIPGNVTSIGVYAFSECSRLSSVTIPDGVTNIQTLAFNGCSGLTSITIPDSVATIENDAFQRCTSLTSVTIPSSVTRIGKVPFNLCTRLTNITVDALNPAYSSAAGVLFNKSQTTLIEYPLGLVGTSYTIPSSVTSIGHGVFWGCSSLTNITAGNSVTNIGDYAFFYCSGLTGIYFQGDAPSLGGGSVFSGANVTVYYLAGTAGWGSTYGGRPTALWNSPPVITTQPTNQTALAGGSVTFNVAAVSTPPLNYQWRKNGTNLVNAGNISGVISTNLTIANLQASDTGSYTVVVTNSYGSVTSQVATLTVLVVPSLAEALNATNLVWTTGGNAPWFAQINASHDGVAAAQSGVITNSQQSWLETTVTGPGTLTFWWRHTSQSWLDFYLNGIPQGGSAVSTNWQRPTYYLGPGSQTIRWICASFSSSAQEAGWLDCQFAGKATQPFAG